jgi:hypothetical protein
MKYKRASLARAMTLLRTDCIDAKFAPAVAKGNEHVLQIVPYTVIFALPSTFKVPNKRRSDTTLAHILLSNTPSYPPKRSTSPTIQWPFQRRRQRPTTLLKQIETTKQRGRAIVTMYR